MVPSLAIFIKFPHTVARPKANQKPRRPTNPSSVSQPLLSSPQRPPRASTTSAPPIGPSPPGPPQRQRHYPPAPPWAPIPPPPLGSPPLQEQWHPLGPLPLHLGQGHLPARQPRHRPRLCAKFKSNLSPASMVSGPPFLQFSSSSSVKCCLLIFCADVIVLCWVLGRKVRVFMYLRRI